MGDATLLDELTKTDWSPLWVSLKTGTCATAFSFVFGTLAAWLVFRCSCRCRAWWDGIFTLPLVLPPTVVGFLLLVFFGWNGPAGKLLRHFDLRVIFSWEATVIAGTVVAFPLVYRIMRASFEQIDPVIVNAGRTLGLTELTIFFKIMLPVAYPGCLAAIVLGFARALGEFGATLMIAGNIPGVTQTIPIAIWSNAEGGNMTAATIWVSVIILFSFLVILPLNLWGGGKTNA